MASAIETPKSVTATSQRVAWRRWFALQISTLLRLGLGGLFIWTAVSKLIHPYDFLFAVYNYDLVGAQAGVWVARAVPCLELVAGVSLLVGVWELGAWLLSGILLAVFTGAQVSAIVRGLMIPCGCARGEQELVTWPHAAQTGPLLLACLLGGISTVRARRGQRDSRGTGPFSPWHSSQLQ